MSNKDFIIKHMNADHSDSLSLFLQAYNGISARESQSATLEDITTSHMIIRVRGTRYIVPLEPPMKDLSESRARMVALHKESLRRLGRSDVTLTEYRGPRGVEAIIFFLCLFYFATCYSRDNLLPGSWVYEHLGYKYMPDVAHFTYNVQPYMFPGVVGIHILEAASLAWFRLRPLGVPVLSGTWCKWVASCLVEGFGSWSRINKIVKEERAKNKSE
ncbi:hypothetical protein N7474_009269 [Penicillium riverlandense]|uniref:uncharacterized protein n=1 Tax=Penicillium riverlandense TaxID=1903569 RepID=UPI00254937F3|nr:uncharacterized protein N7474_009269 [Penicillium riverlandense]KAJ5808000.1 hypothetical protein N7474_009269 [Penicillium riverlandense]